MSNPGHCYGCKTYYSDDDYCAYSVHNNITEGLCPCVSCIIKSMCGRICEEYDKWTDTEGAEEALHKSFRE
jgi:hypothetical protein